MGEEKKHTFSNHDPFTSFMFGGGRKNNRQTDINQWFFGRKITPPTKEKSEEGLQNLLNGIDTEKLFKNVDQLTEITQELKPLWKKVSPHINKFIK